MTQNARQLPARSTDCTTTGTCSSANQRLDLSYGFDANGNVSQITDNTTGGRQTRAMSYDGLDRLTQTTSLMFGTATYAYDVLGDGALPLTLLERRVDQWIASVKAEKA